MRTPFNRSLLFIACLFAVSAQAEPADEASASAETSGPRATRYGRGYEARQGLEAVYWESRSERPERINRPERIERTSRPEPVARVERMERDR